MSYNYLIVRPGALFVAGSTEKLKDAAARCLETVERDKLSASTPIYIGVSSSIINAPPRKYSIAQLNRIVIE